MTAAPAGKPMALEEAVRRHVDDGDTVFVGGFGQCIPFASAHELVRQGRRDLVLCRSGADILFDLLIMLETLSTIVVPEPINRPDERFIVAVRAGEELPAGVEA